MFDVGLGLRLLTPRTLKTENRGRMLNFGFRKDGKPRQETGAGCEGSNVRKKSY